jgi:hypothetical protein
VIAKPNIIKSFVGFPSHLKKSLSETFKEFLRLIVFAKQERETGVHG